MELRHLRYFVTVAEELHFSRAAARLNIATPTLSAQIRTLEALLGAQLFARGTRSVALTHVGRRFLDEARATLRQADQAELVARRAARGDVGTIAVGCVLSAVVGGIVPRSIIAFKKSHPDVVIQARAITTMRQMKDLIEGTIDVGVTLAPDRYPVGLSGFVIDRQTFWLAIPSDHPLAARKQIEAEMLEGAPLIATQLETDMGFWSNIRSITPPGMTMRIVSRVPDIFSVMVGVAAGIGLGVVSESLARLPIPGVVYREIVKTERWSDHVAVFRRNESAPVVRAFIAMLRADARKRRIAIGT
jgi:DNA-binding transcriptional LysR family regulator